MEIFLSTLSLIVSIVNLIFTIAIASCFAKISISRRNKQFERSITITKRRRLLAGEDQSESEPQPNWDGIPRVEKNWDGLPFSE